MIRFKPNIPVQSAAGRRVGRLAAVRAHPWVEDICEEFRLRGYDILSLPNFTDLPSGLHNSPEVHFAFTKALMEKLHEQGGVDLVFSGNASGIYFTECEGVRTTLGEALGVPTVTWWWDDPRLPMHALGRLGLMAPRPLHAHLRSGSFHHFMIDRAMAQEYRNHLGFTHVTHLPVAAAVDRFFPPDRAAPRRAQVIMIGNHYSSRGIREVVEEALGTGAFEQVIDPLIALRRGHPTESLRELMRRWQSRASPEWRHRMGEILADPMNPAHFDRYHTFWQGVTYGWCGLRNEAIVACRRALGGRMKLYGRRWQDEGITSDGYIRDMESQRHGYQQSLMGLSANHGQLQTGLPFRIWELALCGSCIVTQTCAELPDYFQPEVECVTYSDAEQSVEAAWRLLKDQALARRIAEAGTRRALASHQWKHRMDKLFAHLDLPQTTAGEPALDWKNARAWTGRTPVG